VRADEGEAQFFPELPADLVLRQAVAVERSDLGAVFPCRSKLRVRGVGRHGDDRAQAELARGERDRLCVIAGRHRADTALAFLGGKRRQRVERPPEFERSGPLEVLALQQHLRARDVVECA
jgi:hypothetical protein